MNNFLKRTPVLWALFIAFIVIGYSFSLLMPAAGGTLLDTITDPDAAKALVAGLSAEQRDSHFWTTVLLDTAYPLAYGGFFAGMALKFFEGSGKWLALPAFAVILVDLTENTIQALALNGTADFLTAKAVLTPLKFGLFALAAFIALTALIVGIWRRVRGGAA